MKSRRKTYAFIFLLVLFHTCDNWCLIQSWKETVTNGVTVPVDYSPDGKKIAVGGMSDGSVHIYDGASFSLINVIANNTGSIAKSVRISSNNILAIGYVNGILKVYNLATNASISNNANTSQTFIFTVDFTLNGSQLAVCGVGTNPLVLYNVTGTTISAAINSPSGNNYQDCQFTFDSKLLVASTTMYVQQTTTPYTSFPNVGAFYNKNLTCLANRWDYITTPNYSFIVGSDGNGGWTQLSATNIQSGINLGATCAYSKALDYFVMGGAGKKLQFFNATNNNNSALFQYVLSSNVVGTDFSNDGKYLVVSTNDGTIYIYSQICNYCDSSSFYNSTSKICQRCADPTFPNLAGCAACYNSTTCYQCFQGYYLNTSGVCQTCFSSKDGCSVCLNATYCEVAMPGYFLNTTSHAPTTCISVIPGCQICDNATKCNQCYSQYFLNSSNLCVACQNQTATLNCLKCLNSTYCEQCLIGYYLDTASPYCKPCTDTHCVNCNSSTSCLSCDIGYYLSGTACTLCQQDCLACNKTGFCLTCRVGTFLNSTGSCPSCNFPCLACQNLASTCVACTLGYYLNGNICQSCPLTCLTCKPNSNICFSCLQGYYFDSSTSTCLNCSSNCQSCTNSSTCTHCYSGFYVSGGSCSSCGIVMHACILCTTGSTCQFCASEYYLNSSSCQSCPLGCSNCQSTSNCSSCTPGYYYSSSSCLPCNNLCTTCLNSSSFCLSCIVGYYLNSSSTGTCGSCSLAISGCVACHNNLACIQCGIGKYLQSGSSCSPCDNKCVTCLNTSTTCTSCPLGNYLDISIWSCLPCAPFCEQCNSNNTCTSCNIGYYLSGTTCISCPPPCITCNNIPQCLSCDIGYFFNETNQCQICTLGISNCLICDSRNHCYQCAYGYVPSSDNTSCISCSSILGCYHCSSNTTCLACQSGYYISGTTCIPCTQGCIVCTNSTNCLSCSPSYYSGNSSIPSQVGKCFRCVNQLAGCELCRDASYCISCLGGYFQNTSGSTSVCSLCENAIDYCQICNNQTSCTSCKGGYFLSPVDQSCTKCNKPNCQVCDGSGSSCNVCQSGYFVDSTMNGNCSLCANTLQGCQICNNSTSCVQCQSGYYIAGTTSKNNCTLCQSIMPGCIFCQSDSNCVACDSGYYLDSNSKCSHCSVPDCEVCQQNNSAKCVTCSSLYYINTTSPTGCSLCRQSIEGFLTCTNNSNCQKCDVGFYLDGPSCTTCSQTMMGCSICSSFNTCLQCKSMYFLNTTSSECKICSLSMVGCSHCANESKCISCGSGYYMNAGNQCEPCTNLTGCLMCKDSTVCLFCDTGYYLNQDICSLCSNVMSGCYSCFTQYICSSCVGGYILSNGSCSVITVSANIPSTDLLLKTFYVDKNTLIHYLYSRGMYFNKLNGIDWASNMKLSIMTNNGNQISLIILDNSVEWSKDNDYTLIIKTNNPIDYEQSSYMPFTRRLLISTINLNNYKTGIQLTEAVTQLILPLYQHTGPLLVNYPLNSPEFYQSYIEIEKGQFLYFVIGLVIVCILFLKYLFKALVSVPQSPNIGNIMPHILAFKVGALLLFPTYLQYINYCSGFMYADLYWSRAFTKRIVTGLVDERDLSPAAFSLFYINMNLASMYLLAICTLILLAIIGFIVGKSLGAKHTQKMNAFFTFLYNFFVFGATFAGCASIQGSVINSVSFLNANGAFYILGVLLYFSVFCQCIYMVSQNKEQNFWKVRVLFKATLLSLSHLSPVYLVLSTTLIDLILIIVEYNLSAYAKKYKKSWIFANVLVNLALILLIFLPIVILTLVMVSTSIVCIIFAQTLMHFLQYKSYSSVVKLQETTSEKQKNEINLWDLNIQDISQIHVLNQTINHSQNNFLNISKITKVQTTKRTGGDENYDSLRFDDSQNGDDKNVDSQKKDTENQKKDTENEGDSPVKRQRNFKKIKGGENKKKSLQVQSLVKKYPMEEEEFKDNPIDEFIVDKVLNKK